VVLIWYRRALGQLKRSAGGHAPARKQQLASHFCGTGFPIAPNLLTAGSFPASISVQGTRIGSARCTLEVSVTGHLSPKLLCAAALIFTLFHSTNSFARGQAAPDQYGEQSYADIKRLSQTATSSPPMQAMSSSRTPISSTRVRGLYRGDKWRSLAPGFPDPGVRGFGGYEYRYLPSPPGPLVVHLWPS
jgi:hypothetical protein